MPNATPILLLAATVLLAACGGPAPVPEPSTTTVPAPTAVAPEPTVVPGSSTEAQADILVRFETRGGECPNGPCGFQAVIHRDGTVERTDGIARDAEDAELARLARGIDQADWDAILAVPFTGECPVNFDGQEQIYTFSVQGREVVVAGCTTAFDPTTEPFATVQDILFAIGG